MSEYRFSNIIAKNLQQGFTIIEVLVAIAILTIGILAMVTMQATSIKGNATANRISEATTWGADQVEQFFAKDFDDVTDIDADGLAGLNDSECCKNGNDPAGVTVTDCSAKADVCLAQGGYFIYSNVAEDEPLTEAPKTTKTIRVIVNRTDIEGNTKSVSFDYFRTEAR